MGAERSTLTEEILLLYGTDYFVETGTHKGDAVQMAIEAGFSDIRSCEKDLEVYRACRERFDGDIRVTLYWGDSIDRLSEMLCDITDPITMWLDTGCANILAELGIISDHAVKDHVILIGNMHLCENKIAIVDAIHAINPRYIVDYENDRNRKRNILVAHIPTSSEEEW